MEASPSAARLRERLIHSAESHCRELRLEHVRVREPERVYDGAIDACATRSGTPEVRALQLLTEDLVANPPR
jgi:hypothetical protein